MNEAEQPSKRTRRKYDEAFRRQAVALLMGELGLHGRSKGGRRVRTREGWLYVAGVLDRCSRHLLGLAMGPRLDASLPHAALRQALVRRGIRRGDGLIHHSDQGVQYASDLYQDTLRRHGLLPSMSRRGHCTDNAHMESFWAPLKSELLAGRPLAPQRETQTAIFQYIEVFYNRKRLHSALGYLSPVDFERQLNSTHTPSPSPPLSSFSRQVQVLGNVPELREVLLRAGSVGAHAGEVQLPGQLRSEVQLGNEGGRTFGMAHPACAR